MSMLKTKVGEVWGAVRSMAGTPWAKRAGRGAGYALGVALLAVVGSGNLARWLSPAPSLGLGVAEAATVPPPSVTAAPRSGKAAAADPPRAAIADPAEVASAPATVATAAMVEAAEAAPGVVADGGAPSSGLAPDGKVILNLASEEDLRRLPGVGHGRAQAILALRERMKKFTRVEDLLKVKGIGRRKLAQLRPLVRVD